ncbi:MAG: ATP-binding protein [Burkholderiales bacterium]
MSRTGRAHARVLLALGLALLLPLAALPVQTAEPDGPVEPAGVWVLTGASEANPPSPDAPWQHVTLPDDTARSRPAQARQPAWYRIDFERLQPTQSDAAPWSVYLPYLYHGGSVWLNGVLLAEFPVSGEQVFARSYRPRLVTLPAALLRPGRNEVAIFAAHASVLPMQFAQARIGPAAALQPLFDQRLFWARTVPQLTVFGSVLVAGSMLLIWWRRRAEVLYGLFGVAAFLWGIRSNTFLIDAMPWPQWHWWRVLFQCASGGFVVAMALFSLRLARLEWPRVERALLGYWLIGPLWFAVGGFAADTAIGRWWLGGMMAVGIVIVAVTLPALARQKKLLPTTLRITIMVTVLLGIHDYLLTWRPDLLARLLPEWTGQRIFLLHFGASAMLLAMGGLLTARFIKSLVALDDLNRTLEARVADRERALANNFAQLAALQRQQAAADERQLIMRDLHDGLGSQLFTSLSRVERGDMDSEQVAAALRACIADMRLALDALSSEQNNIGAAFGNLMFRWQPQLLAAGVQPSWNVDIGDEALLTLPPHDTLHLLRIAQEALTNVLKHADARHVAVRLQRSARGLELQVDDDGRGLHQPNHAAGNGSRGIDNMRSRARRLGGTIDWQPADSSGGGTRVLVVLPLASASSACAPQPQPVAAGIA